MSMIWLEERLNEAKLPVFVELLDGELFEPAFVELFEPAFVELFESAFVELPPVVGVAVPLSGLAVGCKGLCVGRDESGVCPFAVAPPAKKSVSTDTATRAAMRGRAGWLGVTLSVSAKVEDRGMSISFYNLKLRNLTRRHVMGSSVNCHSFVVRRKSWAIRNG
jgi:hypothetical protein